MGNCPQATMGGIHDEARPPTSARRELLTRPRPRQRVRVSERRGSGAAGAVAVLAEWQRMRAAGLAGSGPRGRDATCNYFARGVQ